MKLFNTLSKKKEEFKPLVPGKVGMYVCGPTVYDVGHVGHARSAVSFDLIRRYFIYKGLEVNFVSNITDVEDKMIKRAKEEGITEAELAERIIPEYAKDYGALSVLAPTHQSRATQYISQMVALIEKLYEKGIAYETEDGVYFEVKKFSGYGKLSGQKLEDVQAGARVAVDEKKRNPEDFALWKKAKLGEPTWMGPRGMEGRPGWHIECSAMSAHLLGETFDIHGGGIDLQFPHHEDEIAQSESASGKTFARLWLHNGHVQVNKEKMSKSLGNFFTIKEILAKWHPMVVRYFLLSTHYRMPIDFTDGLLEQAKNSLSRLQDFMRRLRAYAGPKGTTESLAVSLQKMQKDFEEAMDDDMEIVKALASIFEFVRDANRAMDQGTLSAKERDVGIQMMESLDTVLAVLGEQEVPDAEIQKLIDERIHARKNKDFKRSDELRDLLKTRGIELEDTKDGTVWKKIL